jgi:pSer/pThr/pTyr-binding forkhead associated (FHA) protein
MPLQLIVNLGTERRLFPLASSPMRIGRGSNNAIQIPDPTVSKEHAEIAPAGSGWTIRDLGSRNGTRVNGNEVHEAVAIRENDALEIGKVQARLGTDAAAGMAARC